MTAIALTAAQIAPVYPDKAEIYDFVAAASITAGQAVYLASTGTVNLADANGSGTLQFRGIALNAAAAGQAVSVLKKGHCYGFTVSGLTIDDIAYLSDTAGGLDTSAGSTSVICGRVMCVPDKPTYTKVLWVEANWVATYA